MFGPQEHRSQELAWFAGVNGWRMLKHKTQTPSPVAGLAPRYRVILHNDETNTMDHVVATLLRVVPRLTRDEAHEIMLEAHRTGVALVIVCALEHAEFYRDGLRSAGLGATLELE